MGARNENHVSHKVGVGLLENYCRDGFGRCGKEAETWVMIPVMTVRTIGASRIHQ